MNEILLKELKDVTILCVEDDSSIRELIVKALKYYSNDVYEACDGIEAYEVYEEVKPKIILSDIQMKNMDGIKFVKKIRENDANTMIIMLTAFSNKEYLMDLINLNITQYILKPLNLEKLEEALLKYTDKKLSQQLLLAKDLVLNLQTRELIYQNTKKIPLRKREKDFLQMLFEHKNNIIRYEQIEIALWQEKDMTTYALKSFIKELRVKIPLNIIKNIPQEGYTLLLDLKETDENNSY